MANVCSGMSWEDSLITVIPQRKNAELKSVQAANDEEDEQADEGKQQDDSS